MSNTCVKIYDDKTTPYLNREGVFTNKSNPFASIVGVFTDLLNPYSSLCLEAITLNSYQFQDGSFFLLMSGEAFEFN